MNEETLIVEILIDKEFNFADCLERRSLKLQLFQEEINKEEFLQHVTQKNFGKGKQESLQVDTKKLQAKYNAIKRPLKISLRKCCEIKDRPRKGSGLAPKSNPERFENIDSIFGELVPTSLDTSYSQEVIQNDNENESFEDNAEGDSDNDLYDDSEDDNESNNANKEDKIENVLANNKKAIVAKPHKKRNIVLLQTQALSQLARGMTKLIESQMKRHKEQMEFGKEIDRAFLEFKTEEAGKNRRHELEIAKTFASSMNNYQKQGDFRYNFPFPTFDSTRCKFS